MPKQFFLAFTLLLFLAIPCRAQSDPNPSNAAPPSTADGSAKKDPANVNGKKKPKVWTNDDISKGTGGVSVVGDPYAAESSSTKPQNAKASESARERMIASYKNQIAQMEAQIAGIDKRIDQLKNFKAENTAPSGGIKMHQGYNMVPVEEQVKQLNERKKDLLAKIEEVETEAHKNGIESGDLR